MINNPYAVLGVPEGSSQEEIKKAYRKKAKECHPDLHPDDPDATRKMNEINEAYDMLMNPHKYEQQRAQEAQRQQWQSRQGGGYYQQGSPSGGFDWTDGGFDFEDIFGFGFSGAEAMHPRPEPGDSAELRQAIADINNGQFRAASDILQSAASTYRNARWYYLSALANYGMGNSVFASEQIRTAMQMDPNNRIYRQLFLQWRNMGQTYERNAEGFDMYATYMRRLCFGLCIAQLCCPCCHCYVC